MGHVDKRSITLSPELAAVVDDVVAAGEYASASEVIRDALRLWEQRRQMRERDVEVLRRLWDEGKASGRVGRPDVKRLITEERAKLKRSKGGRG